MPYYYRYSLKCKSVLMLAIWLCPDFHMKQVIKNRLIRRICSLRLSITAVVKKWIYLLTDLNALSAQQALELLSLENKCSLRHKNAKA